MSPTMAMQGGRVQLEQSDRCPALNMAEMAIAVFLRGSLEEMEYLTKRPRAEVREEMKWVVESLGRRMLKAAIERHPAMLRQNHMNGCVPCQTGTKSITQTSWRRTGMGTPPPDGHSQPTPEPKPPLPRIPPVSPGDNARAQSSQSDNLPPGYVYSHRPLPSAQFSNLDAYAQDSQHDTDCIPDMLTDEGTYTG